MPELGSPLSHPERLVSLAFAAAILVGAGLLMIPAATAGSGGASYATPDTVVKDGDVLVIAGETPRAEGFGELG